LWIQVDRGYRLAWISYTLQARFGVWVEIAPVPGEKGDPPDEDVLTFVDELLARYRAGRATAVPVLPVLPVLPVHELPPPSSGKVHFRGAGGSACGHLREWHLKNAPHRFSEDLSKVTCTHCRNGQDRPQCRPPPARPLERAPAPRVVPVCFRHEGSETRH
jgi:hypothetical protein